jgi:hypothetical protein
MAPKFSDPKPYDFSIANPTASPKGEEELHESVKKIVDQFREHELLPDRDTHEQLNDPQRLQRLHSYLIDILPKIHYEEMPSNYEKHSLSRVQRDYILSQREQLIAIAIWVDVEVNGEIVIKRASKGLIEKICNKNNSPFKMICLEQKDGIATETYRIQSHIPHMAAAIQIVVAWMKLEFHCPDKYYRHRLMAYRDPLLAHSLFYALEAFGLLEEARNTKEWFMSYTRKHAQIIWEAACKKMNNVFVIG